MPMIQLTTPAGTLGEDAASRLLDELSRCLLRWEQAPDTEFFREVTWAYHHEVPLSRLRVNGASATRVRLDVTVPAGAFSQRRKDGLIGEVHDLITAALGADPADALHVWTLINEVPDGNWGAGGRTVQYEQLRALAAGERSPAQA